MVEAPDRYARFPICDGIDCDECRKGEFPACDHCSFCVNRLLVEKALPDGTNEGMDTEFVDRVLNAGYTGLVGAYNDSAVKGQDHVKRSPPDEVADNREYEMAKSTVNEIRGFFERLMESFEEDFRAYNSAAGIGGLKTELQWSIDLGFYLPSACPSLALVDAGDGNTLVQVTLKPLQKDGFPAGFSIQPPISGYGVEFLFGVQTSPASIALAGAILEKRWRSQLLKRLETHNHR